MSTGLQKIQRLSHDGDLYATVDEVKFTKSR